jgi:ABC-type arginine transport system permease subunit
MRKSVIVAGATQQPFTIYSATAVSYLVMTILSMQVLKRFWKNRGKSGDFQGRDYGTGNCGVFMGR